MTKFKAAKVRFSKPVLPGQTIRTDMWKDQNRVLFQSKVVETGSVLLTGAYVELHGDAKSQDQVRLTIMARANEETLLRKHVRFFIFLQMCFPLPTCGNIVAKAKFAFWQAKNVS